MIRVTNRVTRRNVLQTNRGTNIAGENFADLFALIGVHLKQTPDPLSLPRAYVQHAVPSLQLPGVHADKRELSNKGISHDLERQRREWLFVVRFARDRLHIIRIGSMGLAYIDRPR